jgi:luciferase family oxidoreductase group 1
MAQEDTFPQDVQELMAYLGDTPGAVQAIPGTGTNVPIWILGSSLVGAQLAAYLGLPYAFASHFAPAMLAEALEVYRRTFRPSERLEKPHVMIAVGVAAAETDAEATFLRSSQLLAFARLRSGRPRPTHDLEAEIPEPILSQVKQTLSCSATGSATTVRQQLAALIDRYTPDEVMVTGMMHHPAARVRSAEIAAAVLDDLRSTAKAA